MDKKLVQWAVLGILGLDLLVVFPFQIFSFFKFSKKTSVRFQEFKREKQNITRLPQMEKNLKKEEQEINKILDSSIREKDLPLIMGAISEIASKNRVRIEEIHPAEPKNKTETDRGTLFSIPIICEGRAKFHNLISFINSLENYKKFIGIDNFNISGSQSRHKFSLRLNTFIFEPKEEEKK